MYLQVELEDIGSLKKIRVSHDGKGARKEWYLECVEMTNMLTNKQYLFMCKQWLSKSKENSKGLTVDISLYKSGKKLIDSTSYKISGE